MLQLLLLFGCIHQLVLLSIHEGFCFQHGLLNILHLNIVFGRKMFDFVLQLQNYSVQIGNFQALFIESFI